METIRGVMMLIFMFTASLGMSATGNNVTGTWQGTLKAGLQELRVALHVTRSAGALKATFDSISQNAYGIPVTSISVNGSKLSFAIVSIHGSYEGVLAADGKSIDGTWTQGMSFPLKFTRSTQAAEARPAKPSDIDGTWAGVLNTGVVNLHIVYHIWNTSQGLCATTASPDQSPQAIPVTKVTRTGSNITFEVSTIDGNYQGTINAGRTLIKGTWTQHGASLPLILKRVKGVVKLYGPRPQNPKGPLPYRQEQVRFEDRQGGLQLAGTLTIPPGKGPFPAVVLIAGSGPQNRNEEVMGHKVFLVLADYLTRKNIVVLRYDKRGVGQSGGNIATATTADFANDAEAAFNYLRKQPKVNPREVGLIGHSEGGEIAPMVAARDRNVAFIVMMAGQGVPGDQLLVAQVRAIDEANGMSPQKAQQAAKRERKILASVKNANSEATLKKELRAELGDKIPEGQIGASVHIFDSPWFRYFIDYDPAPTLEKVRCPVLAMIGSKDTQVPASQNLPAIRKALTAGGNKDFQVVEMQGLNHLFQPAKTGSPTEYGQIETTIAPAALEKISSWILKQTSAG